MQDRMYFFCGMGRVMERGKRGKGNDTGFEKGGKEEAKGRKKETGGKKQDKERGRERT